MPREKLLEATLSELIVEALSQIGLVQEDILDGPFNHKIMAWQVPPLIVEETLFGIPLTNYMTEVLTVRPVELYSLYTEALEHMRNGPSRVLSYEGYRATSQALPWVRVEERQLYLSLPDGFPAVTDYAGVLLSLECAHMLRSTVKLEDFIEDDDNYCAVLEGGNRIGVIDGLPAYMPDIWDLPILGAVQEMLRTPRGAIFEGCDYNVTAKVRSVLCDWQATLRDYTALDWAVQTLRVIDGERALLKAIRNMRAVAFERKVRLDNLHEVVRVVNQVSLTDRQRITTLKHLLVPDLMSVTEFSKKVYPFHSRIPPMVADKVLSRMQANVNQFAADAIARATAARKSTSRER